MKAALKLRTFDDPDTLARSRAASEELQPIYDTRGTDTGHKRRVNVFLQWRDTGSTDEQKREAKSLSAHGVTLLCIYAKAHGVAGGRDTDVTDYIDNDVVPNRDWVEFYAALTRSTAAKEMQDVLNQVGIVSATVLDALCHDWFFGDGKAVERANGRREAPWRSVVRGVCKKHGKVITTHSEESFVVWEALKNLSHAKW